MVIEVRKWPDKYVWERFVNGVDWAERLDGDEIASVQALLIYGDVDLDQPFATDFEGAIQSVAVSGGTPGPQAVSCRVVTVSGLQLEETQRFNVV